MQTRYYLAVPVQSAIENRYGADHWTAIPLLWRNVIILNISVSLIQNKISVNISIDTIAVNQLTKAFSCIIQDEEI